MVQPSDSPARSFLGNVLFPGGAVSGDPLGTLGYIGLVACIASD